MTDSTRLRALKGLTALLKTITPAHGYQHDLSDYDDDGLTKARVFRGRVTYGEDDPIPMVSILEMPREPVEGDSPAGSKIEHGPWELMLQGFVADDKDNPLDPAYGLLADVKLALIRERMKRGATPALRTYSLLGQPSVTDIILSRGVCRPPDAVSAKAYFWLIVTLAMVEDPANPFA